MKDKDHAYSEYIGAVSVSVEALVAAGIVEGDFPIVDSRRGSGSGGRGDRGHLSLRVQFIRTSEVVPSFDIESYFSMKTNNGVTLYQDACCLDVKTRMPQFASMELPNGDPHQVSLFPNSKELRFWRRLYLHPCPDWQIISKSAKKSNEKLALRGYHLVITQIFNKY